MKQFKEFLQEKKEPVKTKSAKKVLQLMDKYEDGSDRYMEFVKKVAKEDKISVKQLEKELDPFI
jgi:Ca2+-binding EF-hand superfamily protein